MPNRKVELAIKVQAMRECLRLDPKRVQAVLRKYAVSQRSAFRWYHRILEHLPAVLQTEKRGPKGSAPAATAPPVHATLGSNAE